MKAFLLLLAMAVTGIPNSDAAENTVKRHSGFFGGAGFLHHSDFFIPAKWKTVELDVSASSPHLILGYIRRTSGNVGWVVRGGVSWFKLPDFNIQLFPDMPEDMQESKDYSSVKLSLMTLDLGLVFYLGKQWEFDLGFCFGIQSDSETSHETDLISNPFDPQRIPVEEKHTFPVGGAGLGITYGFTPRIAAVANARLIVGLQTSSGYELYIDGSPVGDPYGETRYMKQLSLGMIYRL